MLPSEQLQNEPVEQARGEGVGEGERMKGREGKVMCKVMFFEWRGWMEVKAE